MELPQKPRPQVIIFDIPVISADYWRTGRSRLAGRKVDKSQPEKSDVLMHVQLSRLQLHGVSREYCTFDCWMCSLKSTAVRSSICSIELTAMATGLISTDRPPLGEFASSPQVSRSSSFRSSVSQLYIYDGRGGHVMLEVDVSLQLAKATRLMSGTSRDARHHTPHPLGPRIYSVRLSEPR